MPEGNSLLKRNILQFRTPPIPVSARTTPPEKSQSLSKIYTAKEQRIINPFATREVAVTILI